MPPAAILLSIASLLALVLGIAAWRLTSSRPLLINILLSSAFLLCGAYASTNNQRPEFAYILPFFAAMLCGGRAIALLWRSRQETELLNPGLLMSGVTAAALGGAIFAWLHR